MRERAAKFLKSETLRCFLVALGAIILLHTSLLRLPYFWDEAGYYIPAACDLFQSGLLIPQSTLPTGHTPLVMVYLALAWKVLGFSPLVTRLAMLAVAAGCLAALYALGRLLAGREVAVWSGLLLALCPLFFAQSSMAHLDLAAALFTTLAVLALLEGRWWRFALWGSLAVLSKETAVVLLPVAWALAFHKVGARRAVPLQADATGARQPASQSGFGALGCAVPLLVPLLPLGLWALYYHHATGFWTGNREYLQYNLFSTLHPIRIALTLLRRLYELWVGGFNWLLVAGALAGAWWSRRNRNPRLSQGGAARQWQDFLLMAGGLAAVYLLLLSAVGGAILPRYLLPVFPVLILVAVIFIFRLPRRAARAVCAAAAGCFIGAWFINPPCPFPYEDNLSYADFVHLHQQAARFLEQQAPSTRILTAWPASDELTRPMLGYVRRPLRVVPLEGFEQRDFLKAGPESFDELYLYSRKWEPEGNWIRRWPRLQELQERYFDYSSQVPDSELVARYHLTLLREFRSRGQWVRIYSTSRQPAPTNPH